ncbi:ribosomal-protein-alanine N-acetyltransferase [Parendozoicomonas haliclonae]|uniref:Ribosomal-protein-alanine N-acetyltransferase n=2 Tax=Parendozoicomonas haliclonae TaxID=1960125 RepID=A0A1X7ANN1_9GAMM|nr:ribosomal-protein-alanine N-acetyltransferase [Parendozoicomonas haliclonae]
MHLDNLPGDYNSPEDIQEKIKTNEFIDNEKHVAVVACSQDRVIGFLLGNIWERKSWILQNRSIANIIDLAVEEEFQGNGIGKKLLTEFEQQVKSIGVEEIWVEIYAFNERAVAFYQSCGIKPLIHIGQKKL